MEEKDLKIEETSLNKTEETSLEGKKENIVLRGLKAFWKYLKDIFLNFKESFKYNNMKLPALLVAVPGILLGFFLNFHYTVVVQLSYSYVTFDPETMDMVTLNYSGMPFDYSGIVLFVLMLIGILNIFSAVSMSGKKNKKSVVLATILTSLILVLGALYIYAIVYFLTLVNNGSIKLPDFSFDINFVMAFVSIIGSIVVSIIGVVLGFMRYDRNYKEVER